MSVVLPEASEAMPLTARPKEVFVNVDRQGNIVIAGERLNEAQLLAVLRQAAANNPDRQSVIILRRQALHVRVVDGRDERLQQGKDPRLPRDGAGTTGVGAENCTKEKHGRRARRVSTRRNGFEQTLIT